MKRVYPWDDSGFDGSDETKAFVYEQLHRRRYPLQRIAKKPDSQTRKAIDLALDTILNKDGKPWLIVLSNSAELLQALAIYVPTTYCLSTKKKIFNTSTEDMLRSFRARLPRDDFELDPAGEAIHQLTHSGFLVWENVNMGDKLSLSFAASFYSVLSKRVVLRGARTLFPVFNLAPADRNSVSRILDDVRNSIGDAAASIIEQNGNVLGVKTKVKPMKIRKEQL